MTIFMCLRVVFKDSILQRFHLQGYKPFKCFSHWRVWYLETESPSGVAVRSCILFCLTSEASQIPGTTKYGNKTSRTVRWSLNSLHSPGRSGLSTVCFKFFGCLSEKPGFPSTGGTTAPKCYINMLEVRKTIWSVSWHHKVLGYKTLLGSSLSFLVENNFNQCL